MALDFADDGGHEPLGGRLFPGFRWSLPIHVLESCVSGALSHAGRISCESLAPRHRRSIDHGSASWCLLYGLLLGADAAALCAGRDEPALDRRPDAAGSDGEDSAPNAVGATNRRYRSLRLGPLVTWACSRGDCLNGAFRCQGRKYGETGATL